MDLAHDSSLFASLPYGACLVDREGRIAACNPALEGLLGWRQGWPLSPYLQQAADPAQALSWAVALGKALTGGQTTFLNLPTRLRIDPESSQVVSVVGAVAPWVGPEGEPLGALVLLQDSEQFESVEAARLRFLSMIAHELNSPLNIIDSAAGQMARQLGQDWAATGRLLGVIRAEVERMERLLGSLFAPEPPLAGGPTWEPEPVDLGLLLQRVAERHRFAWQAGQVSVEVAPELPPVQADARALQDGLGGLVDTFLAYALPSSRIQFQVREEAAGLVVRVDLCNAEPPDGREGVGPGPAAGECCFWLRLPLARADGDGGRVYA